MFPKTYKALFLWRWNRHFFTFWMVFGSIRVCSWMKLTLRLHLNMLPIFV